MIEKIVILLLYQSSLMTLQKIQIMAEFVPMVRSTNADKPGCWPWTAVESCSQLSGYYLKHQGQLFRNLGQCRK